jgi:hypothetical protein
VAHHWSFNATVFLQHQFQEEFISGMCYVNRVGCCNEWGETNSNCMLSFCGVCEKEGDWLLEPSGQKIFNQLCKQGKSLNQSMN